MRLTRSARPLLLLALLWAAVMVWQLRTVAAPPCVGCLLAIVP